MKIIKRISAAVFAAFIGTAFSVSAFAAPEESMVASEDNSAVSVQTSDVSAQESSNEVSSDDKAEVSTDSSENSEEINYDFSDKTIGNAVLTANENIITDDGNYQFIAATTRDGNVFYIIIDKLKTTDNVYFLNQVDTFDLKALMSSSEDGETVRVGDDTQLSETVDGESEENSEENEDNEDESDNSDSMNSSLMLIGGIAVLGVIGFVIFKMKKGGGFGKKKSEPQMLDDDFDDDDEINEDKE